MSFRNRLSAVMRCVRPSSIWAHSRASAFLVAVDGEGDAFVEEREVGGLLAFAQLFRGQAQQRLMERAVLRAGHAGRLEHLVIRFVELVVHEGRIA
jgi:hypothetical protein